MDIALETGFGLTVPTRSPNPKLRSKGFTQKAQRRKGGYGYKPLRAPRLRVKQRRKNDIALETGFGLDCPQPEALTQITIKRFHAKALRRKKEKLVMATKLCELRALRVKQ